MSSGFVSGGTTDNPVVRDDEWLRAQGEIEANRRRKEEESRQEGGKSLYEVLQGNKAAKEEAFQESIKLKNQFRNLDEDEVEFLDSVLESTRRKEEEVRRETGEQLDAFRRLQEEKDKELLEGSIVGEDVNGDGKSGSPVSGEGQWAVNARKRKRAKEKEGLRGVKLRKTSSTSERPAGLVKGAREGSARDTEEVRDASLATTGKPMEDVGDSDSPARGIDKTAARLSPERENAARQKLQTTAGLGLADYSSDDED